MSLDIWARIKNKKIHEYEQLGTAYRGWDREEKIRTQTNLTDKVLWINITHNLAEMAAHVPIQFTDIEGNKHDTDLYHIMWRPKEVFKKEIIVLNDLKRPLKVALEYVLSMEDELSEYNPDNGWGHYENFCYVIPEYIRACYKWPDAIVKVSR